ncbi:MAG: cohesin domain-containing protein [Euryarchaeota archaeon]|nr:cohesin domain-containing protein [Euryarchaeota archaeon]
MLRTERFMALRYNAVENEVTMMNHIIKTILSIALLMLLVIGAAADDEVEIDLDAVNVTVNAPEYVSEDTFEVTMNVTDIVDLNGGQFDLKYDPDVLKVLKVVDGDIDDTEIPIAGKRDFTDDDYNRLRILFKLDGADCVSGSGYLAKITFEVVGGIGDTTVIDIADDPDEDGEKLGTLSEGTGAENIPANWIGTTVTIGTAPAASDETPTPTPTGTPVVNVTPDELESVSAPTPAETPVTESLELSSNPSGLTARAESAPAAAVPGASSESSEDGGLPDVPTACDIIPIYSLVGLFALIYAIIQFK